MASEQNTNNGVPGEPLSVTNSLLQTGASVLQVLPYLALADIHKFKVLIANFYISAL